MFEITFCEIRPYEPLQADPAVEVDDEEMDDLATSSFYNLLDKGPAESESMLGLCFNLEGTRFYAPLQRRDTKLDRSHFLPGEIVEARGAVKTVENALASIPKNAFTAHFLKQVLEMLKGGSGVFDETGVRLDGQHIDKATLSAAIEGYLTAHG